MRGCHSCYVSWSLVMYERFFCFILTTSHSFYKYCSTNEIERLSATPLPSCREVWFSGSGGFLLLWRSAKCTSVTPSSDTAGQCALGFHVNAQTSRALDAETSCGQCWAGWEHLCSEAPSWEQDSAEEGDMPFAGLAGWASSPLDDCHEEMARLLQALDAASAVLPTSRLQSRGK